MAKIVLELELDHDSTQLQAILSKDTTAKDEVIHEFINVLEGLAVGAYNGALNVKIGAVPASLSGTFTGDPAADETVTINGVTFTAKASGATGNQFNIGASVTAHAANLAAAINASATAGIADVIRASSELGVITLTSKQAGKIGNAVVVADALANFTWAGSATKLAGGTQDTNKTYQFGKVPTVTY